MKILIVYYSLEGNTKFIAEQLKEKLNADLLELKPVKAYPARGAMKFVAGGFAATVSAAPKLQPYTCNLKDYDFIILGSPVWNSRITPPLNTFLKNENLRGKAVAMYACHGGGGAEKLFVSTEEKVGKLAARAAFTEPLSNKEEACRQAEEFGAVISAL